MCAAIGMNIDATGRHTAESLRDNAVTWVRIVARRDLDISDILMRYRSFGIKTLLTFDRLSIEAYGPIDASHLMTSAQGALTDYYQCYHHLIDAVQTGNEPDHESSSSWTLPVDDVVTLGRITRLIFHDRLVVSPGLVSGQISYLSGADLSWCDALCVHPYLRDAPNPNDIEDIPDIPLLINEYAAFGVQIWVTEWGWWGDDETRGAEEVRDMIHWAAATQSIAVFCYFCFDDAMVAPFGLYRTDGTPKPAASAFVDEAMHAVAVPLPPVDGGVPLPPAIPETPAAAELEMWRKAWCAIVPDLPYDATIATWAIPTYWRAHYADLGSPLGHEIPEGDGPTRQMFAGGALRWTGTAVERIA